ncbi:MAG: hypothetical protein ABII27_04720 [bacterium]
MKCEKCGTENKESAKNCKKCGREFIYETLWMPTWRWHIKTLLIIYVAVIIGYFATCFALERLPPPYNQRQISPEMTPWLK